jgi:hypothetical protein
MASWLDQWRGKLVREPLCKCRHALELHDLVDFQLQGSLAAPGSVYPTWNFACRGMSVSADWSKNECHCKSFRLVEK